MKSKTFLSVLVAFVIAVVCAAGVPAADLPPLNCAPARAYYNFNRKIYYVTKIEDVLPMLPKGQIAFIKAQPKLWQDNKAKWFRLLYLVKPTITNEVDSVAPGGFPIADLTGYAYKAFNNKWAKVNVFVRMQSEEDDWKFVSMRYEGEL